MIENLSEETLNVITEGAHEVLQGVLNNEIEKRSKKIKEENRSANNYYEQEITSQQLITPVIIPGNLTSEQVIDKLFAEKDTTLEKVMYNVKKVKNYSKKYVTKKILQKAGFQDNINQIALHILQMNPNPNNNTANRSGKYFEQEKSVDNVEVFNQEDLSEETIFV